MLKNKNFRLAAGTALIASLASSAAAPGIGSPAPPGMAGRQPQRLEG
jgi:hypothetical protein